MTVEKREAADVAQANVIAIVLESGMVFHSIFIGCGPARSPDCSCFLASSLVMGQRLSGHPVCSNPSALKLWTQPL